MTSTALVLVVEDDPLLLELVQQVLEHESYTVVTATGGQQALQQWEREQPDIVLLDVGLPDMDGYEVCRRLRQRDPLHRTAIIMVTARTAEADHLRGMDLGADEYLTKPFNIKHLTARMQTLLKGHRPADGGQSGAA